MFSHIPRLAVLAAVLAQVNAGIINNVPVPLAPRQNYQVITFSYITFSHYVLFSKLYLAF